MPLKSKSKPRARTAPSVSAESARHQSCAYCGDPFISGKGGAGGLCPRHYRQRRAGVPLSLERLRGPAQGLIPVTARLTPALNKRVLEYAAARSISVSALISEALHRHTEPV